MLDEVRQRSHELVCEPEEVRDRVNSRCGSLRGFTRWGAGQPAGWGARYKCWPGCSGLMKDYLCYVNQAFCSQGPSPRDLSSPWELAGPWEPVLLHIVFFWQEGHFFFFLNRLFFFFLSSFRVPAKLSKRCREFSYTPSPSLPVTSSPTRVVRFYYV